MMLIFKTEKCLHDTLPSQKHVAACEARLIGGTPRRQGGHGEKRPNLKWETESR